jgi:hypothetical protein
MPLLNAWLEEFCLQHKVGQLVSLSICLFWTLETYSIEGYVLIQEVRIIFSMIRVDFLKVDLSHN